LNDNENALHYFVRHAGLVLGHDDRNHGMEVKMKWHSVLSEAITSQQLIEFRYEDDLWRKAEPHTFGLNLKGHTALSAFRLEKQGHPFEQPAWRMYLVEKIREIRIVREGFIGPRPGFNPRPKTFIKVYSQITIHFEAGA
jgi:hypothetical protein